MRGRPWLALAPGCCTGQGRRRSRRHPLHRPHLWRPHQGLLLRLCRRQRCAAGRGGRRGGLRARLLRRWEVLEGPWVRLGAQALRPAPPALSPRRWHSLSGCPAPPKISAGSRCLLQRHPAAPGSPARPVLPARCLAGVAAAGAHLAWQIGTVDLDDSADCAAKFRSNAWYGALLFAGILADRLAPLLG